MMNMSKSAFLIGDTVRYHKKKTLAGVLHACVQSKDCSLQSIPKLVIPEVFQTSFLFIKNYQKIDWHHSFEGTFR